MSPHAQKPASRGSAFTADQLRKRYIVALSLIALLTIVSQAVMQFLISDQEYDSRVVNIAGRQRMLSQRITKTAFYVAEARSVESAANYRQQLAEILALWERSHRGLLNGDKELGLPGQNSETIIALFDRINPHHLAMVAATHHLLTASAQGLPIVRDILTIREHEAPFLQGMDDIVFRYDQEAKHKVSITRQLELGLLTLTLLVLTLEALFIFAPVTRRIRDDMQALEKKEEDMSRLFSSSPTAMLLVDNKDLAILNANQKAADLTGVPIEDLVERNLRAYIDSAFDGNRAFFEKIANKEPIDDHEIILFVAKNNVINALVSVRELSFAGQDSLTIGLTNISELKKAQQALEHFATFDDMTGLVNRRTGLTILSNDMARCRRDARLLSVCFADLDGLKTTNDKYGHTEGNWLLRSAADVLTTSIRAGDVAVRLGGDEFLLIFHDCPKEDAQLLLSRVEEKLAVISLQSKKPFAIGISFGVTAFDPTRHSTPDELIAEADALMYKVKQERKMLAATKHSAAHFA